MATNALLRVDQIDIESAIFAFGSVCLECIERAAKTAISLWAGYTEYVQCSAASLCTPIFKPIHQLLILKCLR